MKRLNSRDFQGAVKITYSLFPEDSSLKLFRVTLDDSNTLSKDVTRDGFYLVIRILMYAFAFTQFSYITADPDLWGHLRFGQDIWEQGRVHDTDPFSYTAQGQPWINHEWFMEVLFYLIYQIFDSTGLLFFKVFLGIFIVHLLSSIYFARSTNIIVYLIVFALIIPVMAPGFMSRPHLATFLCLTLLVYVLQKFFDGNHRIIKWVPLIMLLWVNSHGGVVAGLGIFGMITLVEIFRCYKTGEKQGILLLKYFLLSGLVVLINPLRLQSVALLYPFPRNAAIHQRMGANIVNRFLPLAIQSSGPPVSRNFFIAQQKTRLGNRDHYPGHCLRIPASASYRTHRNPYCTLSVIAVWPLVAVGHQTLLRSFVASFPLGRSGCPGGICELCNRVTTEQICSGRFQDSGGSHDLSNLCRAIHGSQRAGGESGSALQLGGVYDLEVTQLPGIHRRPVPHRVSGKHHRNEPGFRLRQAGRSGVTQGFPYDSGDDQKIRGAPYPDGNDARMGENLPGPHLQTVHSHT